MKLGPFVLLAFFFSPKFGVVFVNLANLTSGNIGQTGCRNAAKRGDKNS